MSSFDRPRHVDVLEFDSSATIFQAGLSRLGRVVEQLEGRVEVLEQENAALKGCLQATDALSPEAFQARLHQYKFSTVLSRHPCDSHVDLSQILLTHELRTALARFANWNVVRNCSCLERQLKELREKIPRVIYVCGGFDGEHILASILKFDPTRFNWLDSAQGSSTSSDCCVCRKSPRPGVSSELESPRTYLDWIGLESPRTRVDYDQSNFVLSQGVWETEAPMAQQRAGSAAAALSGLLYVCGGYDGKSFLQSAECFHPAPEQGSWEPIRDMTQKRHCAAAASLRGRLYVCGGYNGEEALNSAECYDPASNTWEIVVPMAQRRHGAAAAALNGKLYVCGGYDGEQALSSVERYDPERNEWEVMPPLLQRRNVAFAVVLEQKLYVCSGCTGTETLKTMECFNPDLNAWDLVTPMELGRHGAAAAGAGGHLFVCGGSDSAEAPGRLLKSVERYDPATCRWTHVTSMTQARIDMVAVSLFSPASFGNLGETIRDP